MSPLMDLRKEIRLGRTQMSKRELGRVEVLARVRSKQLRVVDAGRLLRVSYRQAKRLWKRYREEGAAGLKHRSAGRTSNRAGDEKFREKVHRSGLRNDAVEYVERPAISQIQADRQLLLLENFVLECLHS